MRILFAIVLGTACGIGSVGASAQILPQLPDLENRIPTPLPSLTINGPGIGALHAGSLCFRRSRRSPIA